MVTEAFLKTKISPMDVKEVFFVLRFLLGITFLNNPAEILGRTLVVSDKVFGLKGRESLRSNRKWKLNR